jgi:hypothetical protein
VGSNFIYDGGTHAPRDERPIAAAPSSQAAWRTGEPTLFRTIIGGLARALVDLAARLR